MADSDHHMVARNLVGIKGMEGLPDFHQHEVGDVDDVVDRTDAHRAEPRLEPLGRVLDVDVL